MMTTLQMTVASEVNSSFLGHHEIALLVETGKSVISTSSQWQKPFSQFDVNNEKEPVLKKER